MYSRLFLKSGRLFTGSFGSPGPYNGLRFRSWNAFFWVALIFLIMTICGAVFTLILGVTFNRDSLESSSISPSKFRTVSPSWVRLVRALRFAESEGSAGCTTLVRGAGVSSSAYSNGAHFRRR